MYNHDRTAELMEQFDKLCSTYKGDITVLERAIGTYFVGRRMGWKILFLIHDIKTLRKYEQILGIEFRNEFEDYEDQAKRMRIYRAIQAVSNFWRAVKGETSLEKTALTNR